MKKILFLLSVIVSISFSQTNTVLFKQEIFPISNPGFEQEATGWNIKPTEKKTTLA